MGDVTTAGAMIVMGAVGSRVVAVAAICVRRADAVIVVIIISGHFGIPVADAACIAATTFRTMDTVFVNGALRCAVCGSRNPRVIHVRTRRFVQRLGQWRRIQCTLPCIIGDPRGQELLQGLDQFRDSFRKECRKAYRKCRLTSELSENFMVQWRTSRACLREPLESIRRGILVLVLVRSHRCQSVRFKGRMGTKTFGHIDSRCCTVPCHGDSAVGGQRIRLREICMSRDFQNMSGDGHVRCVSSNRNDSVCGCG